MKSRLANYPPPRWRSVPWFWVLTVVLGIAMALLLQAFGLPSKASASDAEGTLISNPPAEPVNGHDDHPTPPGSPAERVIANLLRTLKEPTTGPNQTAESFTELSGLLSRTPPSDFEQAVDIKVQLYDLARVLAEAGNFDEADNALALASKLALHPTGPVAPSAVAAVNSAPREGVGGRNSGSALPPETDTVGMTGCSTFGRGHQRAAATPPPAPPLAAQNLELTGSIVRRVQTVLKHDHLYHGRIDGVYGPEAARGVIRLQQKKNLQGTGKIDVPTLRAMNLGNLVPQSSDGMSGSVAMERRTPEPGDCRRTHATRWPALMLSPTALSWFIRSSQFSS
jgi:Putative peptidoglycan binding domain